ncbi:MAG TPA: hypothetical protein VFW47_15080 [Phenylobacterium sp.]|nr:hypothetical protein [Phenylobacterium sp.]
MSSPIEPIRRTPRPRHAHRAATDTIEESSEVPEDRSVPVVTGPAPAPEPERLGDSASVFSAQLMGQDGQKRGLRGGPQVLDAARHTYNRVEYSGAADRRARKGGAAKTEV